MRKLPLSFECLATGLPCEACPQSLDAAAEVCGNLALGQAYLETRQQLAAARIELEELRQANYSLGQRLDITKEDILIEGCISPGGMRDSVQNDTELQASLATEGGGVVYIDLRGQKYVNDTAGRPTGNRFLQSSHQRIVNTLAVVLRGQSDSSPEYDQRQRQIASPDKICRIGGDEFVILLPGISPEDLIRLCADVQVHLSVGRALQNYRAGKLPLIASVGQAHIRSSIEASELLGEKQFWEMFLSLCDTADEQHGHAKQQQYEEMWNVAYSAMGPALQRAAIKPKEGRDILEVFMEQCCPDFIRNPQQYLMPALRSRSLGA